MALSSLTQLTEDQYNRLGISSFPAPPSRSSTGNPDSRITVQLGGWVGTDVLAFKIVDQPSIDANVGYSNASTNILGVTVTNGSSPGTVTTYWTVNMGSGASGTNWTITFNVSDGATSTGTWIFTKGKPPEPFKGKS